MKEWNNLEELVKEHNIRLAIHNHANLRRQEAIPWHKRVEALKTSNSGKTSIDR
jgi:hypothetical protein